jgi:hypothetical protein
METTLIKPELAEQGYLRGAAAVALRNSVNQGSFGAVASAVDLLQPLDHEEIERRIHMANTLVDGGLDRTDYYEYDTMTVAANTAFPNKTTLFTTPQQGSSKNLAQTDMDSFGQLVAPEIFVVKAFRCFVLNNVTPTDLLALFTNVSITLTIGKKPMWKGVAWMLPAGGGLWLQGNQVGTAPAGSSVLFSASNGDPNILSAYTLRDPYTINAGENFGVVLTAETAFNTQANTTNPPGTGFTIVMALEGSLFQAVR